VRLRTKPKTLAGAGITGLLTFALVAGSAAAAGAAPDPGTDPAAQPATPAGAPAAESLTRAGAAAVPAALQPPDGHVPLGAFAASGVQVYRCTAAAWAFVEPVATLTGRVRGLRGRHTAIHFRGPSWQSGADGSLVEAAAVANAPVAGSIPQLLLEARTNRGEGVFGAVTYIQRLATSGGAAPAGTCEEGALASVPYRADYRFFGAAAS
jgi:hypothetical protein